MTSIVAAQNAMIKRLQDMPDRPEIAYPNGPITTDLPRIVVQVVAPAQRPHDMEGQTQADVEINARIETKDGEFDAEANDILTAIQQRFRPATKFDDVTIIDSPRPGATFTEGGVFHLPVIIRGRTDF